MPLSTVQSMFIEATGREDLDTTDSTGARWYINAGQRLLDSRQDTVKTLARRFIPVVAGQYIVHAPECKAIMDVWIAGADGKTQLVKKPLTSLRTSYPDLFSSQSVSVLSTATESDLWTQGTLLTNPAYWCPMILGLSPDQNEELPSGLLYGLEGIQPGDHFNRLGVYIAPPPGEARTVEIIGEWFSQQLTEPWHKSFWTEMCPAALVAAACWVYESIVMRNSEGAQDYMLSINTLLLGVDKDHASGDLMENMVMEG